MAIITTFIIGLLFGAGIIISGMANPAKVLNFFDVAGSWDPSLMFVMGGALAVTFIGYRLVWTAPRPLLADSFQVPTNRHIDGRLVAGSAIFGVGWGLVGFCPGAALPVIAVGGQNVLIFVASLVVGIAATRLVLAKTARSSGERMPTQSA